MRGILQQLTISSAFYIRRDWRVVLVVLTMIVLLILGLTSNWSLNLFPNY
jgi:hypothetical protein